MQIRGARSELLESSILNLTNMLDQCYVDISFGFHSRCLGCVLTPLHLKTFISMLLFMVCVELLFLYY